MENIMDPAKLCGSFESGSATLIQFFAALSIFPHQFGRKGWIYSILPNRQGKTASAAMNWINLVPPSKQTRRPCRCFSLHPSSMYLSHLLTSISFLTFLHLLTPFNPFTLLTPLNTIPCSHLLYLLFPSFHLLTPLSPFALFTCITLLTTHPDNHHFLTTIDKLK